MSEKALKLISDIEAIIYQDNRDGNILRHTMLRSLNNARSIYAMKITDDFLKYDAAKDFPADVALALCYPSVLTPEQIGEIIILYGNFFKWETQDRLNLLLDQLPGKHEFKPCDSLNWTENVRLRMEKVPSASVVTFNMAQFSVMIDNLRETGWNSGTNASAVVGKKIGAIGYVHTVNQVSFYFDDRDTAVLATLTYS